MKLTAAHITAATKAAGAGSGMVASAATIADLFNTAIEKYGDGLFKGVNEYAALVSECMMESAYFRTTREYSNSGSYQPYRGRTFIQLTWKTNYAAFGKWCKSVGLLTDADYFVDSPAKLEELKWAALGGVWYFTKIKKKDKAGVLHPIIWWADDMLAVGRAVNMGNPLSKNTPNGQKARDAAYVAVVKALKTTPAPTPAKPAEPPTQPPEVTDVAKVKFRGGWTCSCVATSLPVVEQAMIERGLIKQSVDIYQLGYRNDVSASAGTHAAGGNTDVAQFSDAQIKVWREFGWTIQHRTKAQGFDMDHGHGWPWGCTHLSSGGKAQAAQWENKQNGLASKGKIVGMWPVPNWRDAMNAYLKEKENELPSTADVAKALTADKDFLAAVANAVLNADVIPNNFTGNVDNKTVSPKTALSQIGKDLDAILAAVRPTPTPPVPVTDPIA